jgi:hypothetical protein
LVELVAPYCGGDLGESIVTTGGARVGDSDIIDTGLALILGVDGLASSTKAAMCAAPLGGCCGDNGAPPADRGRSNEDLPRPLGCCCPWLALLGSSHVLPMARGCVLTGRLGTAGAVGFSATAAFACIMLSNLFRSDETGLMDEPSVFSGS